MHLLPEELKLRSHLWLQLLARGLYAHQLRSWYAAFPASQIHVLCSEDLMSTPVNELNAITAFLGMHSYDFSDTVAGGLYNTRSHPGFDEITPWSELSPAVSDMLPTTRDAMSAFFSPYNEQLFELTGVRCDWK